MTLIEATRDETAMSAKADAIRELSAHLHAANARLAELLADFTADDTWNVSGDWRSLAHWLGINCGFARAEAEILARVAAAAEAMPTVLERAGRGEVSLHVAAGAARVATPENEAKLAEIAASSTPAQACRVFSNYRTARRREEQRLADERDGSEDGDPAATEPEHRSFWRTWFDDNGTWRVNGAAPPEIGALLDRLYEAGAKQVELALGDNTARVAPDPADTLRAMADLGLDSADHRRLRDEGNERFLVTVLIDLETLVDNTIRPDSICRLQSGPHVTPGLVRRLAEEGTLQLMWHRTGIPLKLGHETRLATREQKRALRFRDGGCSVPGCTAEKHLHAHHIEWWPLGATDIDNMVLLCRFHHRLLHRGLMSIHTDGSQTFVFRDRYGQEIGRRGPPPGGPPGKLEDLPAHRNLGINADTTRPHGGYWPLTDYARNVWVEALLTASEPAPRVDANYAIAQ